MKSKTKTFEADTEFGDLMNWFVDRIESVEHEIITNTPPDYDVQVRTVKKYKITVTEME